VTLVVAGIIERDGEILIGQRRAGGRHALKWEFPGGKVEPGETPRQALERELREELAIEAAIGDEIVRYEYCYPGRPPILLIFFRVVEYSGAPLNLEFEQIAWARRDSLPEYDFLEGDVDFVRSLARSPSR
jgi:8-oxo-dGTP diphosphatase